MNEAVGVEAMATARCGEGSREAAGRSPHYYVDPLVIMVCGCARSGIIH